MLWPSWQVLNPGDLVLVQQELQLRPGIVGQNITKVGQE